MIASGKFGLYLLNNFDFDYKLVAVNGSLRKDEKIINISPFVSFGERYLFLDDSFYSGKTRDIVQNELNKYGASIVDTFVVYDGSIKFDKTVKSLYRYHTKLGLK